MKQVFNRRGEIVVQDVPIPTPGPGEVLVQNRYSLVSTGTELSSISSASRPLWRRALNKPEHVSRLWKIARERGVRTAEAYVREQTEQMLPLGYSCAGVVQGVGELVADLAPGDLVACAGATKANHAEFVVVPRRLCARVEHPSELRVASAATVGAIALHAFRRAAPTVGETVVVIGLGLLGQIIARIARRAGCKVIAFDLTAERVERATSRGVAAFVSTGRDPVQVVRESTAMRGADVVIIAATTESSEPINQSLQMARRRARICLVGATGLTFERGPFYEKELEVVMATSYGPGRYDPEYEEDGIDYPVGFVRWTAQRNLEEFVRLCAADGLDIADLLEPEFPIEDAPSAYEALSAGRHLSALLRYSGELQDAPAERRRRLVSAPSAIGDRVPVAVIGAGAFARSTHLPNLALLHKRFHLHTVASRNSTNATALARLFRAEHVATDADAVIDDPAVSAVILCTRHDQHAPLTARALKAGKAVFVEKPLALTEAELAEVEAAARASAAPLLVGYNRRFSPALVSLKRLLQERTGPVMATYRVNAGAVPPGHWTNGAQGGGRAIGEGCHMIDALTFLIGSRPKLASVSSADAPGQVRDENFTATFEWKDGSHATLIYTALGNTRLEKERLEVFSGGVAAVMDDFTSLTVHGASGFDWAGSQDKGHFATLERFADQLQHGGEAIALDDLLHTTRVTLEIARRCGRSA